MATAFKFTPEEEQSIKDRRALVSGAKGAGLGTLKLGAAAADIGTLPIRAGMGAVNTLLRVPNAFGAGIPYIPEQAFGGSSSSITPYMDKLRKAYPEMLSGASALAAPTTPAVPSAQRADAAGNRIPAAYTPIVNPRTGDITDLDGNADFSRLDVNPAAYTPTQYSGSGRVITAPAPAPFTAADVVGTAKPAQGYGAIVNNSTGTVTNLNASPTAADREADALHAQGKAVYGVGNNFGVRRLSYAEQTGAALGAVLNQRRGAATETRQAAVKKALVDAQAKAPTSAKAAAEATRIGMIMQAANTELARGNVDGYYRLLLGQVTPQDKNVVIQDLKGNPLVVNATRATQQVPSQVATEKTVTDTLAAHPEFSGSRQKAIAALKATGRYSVTGLQ